MYLCVYGYSVYKTSASPEETYWGYICIISVGYLFTAFIKYILSLPEKKSLKNFRPIQILYISLCPNLKDAWTFLDKKFKKKKIT